jgi:predicted porin
MYVIMGNTGGDNRVEFATRLNNSIWYESPTFKGFQFTFLFAPGQNRSAIRRADPIVTAATTRPAAAICRLAAATAVSATPSVRT